MLFLLTTDEEKTREEMNGCFAGPQMGGRKNRRRQRRGPRLGEEGASMGKGRRYREEDETSHCRDGKAGGGRAIEDTKGGFADGRRGNCSRGVWGGGSQDRGRQTTGAEEKEQEEKKRMVMTKQTQRADEVEQRREAVRKPLLLDGELLVVNAMQVSERREVRCGAKPPLGCGGTE